MKIELILVPYDVDRDNTATARSPRELLARGFEEGLRKRGWEVRKSLVWSRRETGKEAIVASVARETARVVARARSRRRFPLVLSGGCLSAAGVIAGLQRTGHQVGIFWVDAHGDFNTPETTPSGYWDGMALAAVCGRSLAEIYKRAELQSVRYTRIVHVGGRSFDPRELEDFRRLSVLLVPAAATATEETFAATEARLGAGQDIYLHVDTDGLDPQEAPAVAFHEPDGVRLADLLALLEHLPPPRAMTLAGMNFERVDERHSEVMVATCLELAEAVLERVAPAG